MIAEFYHTITRNDEDIDVLIEYSAIRCFGEIDVELLSVTADDDSTAELTHEETNEIYSAIFERVDEDWADAQADEGDRRRDEAINDIY
jgi:hypothetical protein